MELYAEEEQIPLANPTSPLACWRSERDECSCTRSIWGHVQCTHCTTTVPLQHPDNYPSLSRSMSSCHPHRICKACLWSG